MPTKRNREEERSGPSKALGNSEAGDKREKIEAKLRDQFQQRKEQLLEKDRGLRQELQELSSTKQSLGAQSLTLKQRREALSWLQHFVQRESKKKTSPQQQVIGSSFSQMLSRAIVPLLIAEKEEEEEEDSGQGEKELKQMSLRANLTPASGSLSSHHILGSTWCVLCGVGCLLHSQLGDGASSSSPSVRAGQVTTNFLKIIGQTNNNSVGDSSLAASLIADESVVVGKFLFESVLLPYWKKVENVTTMKNDIEDILCGGPKVGTRMNSLQKFLFVEKKMTTAEALLDSNYFQSLIE